MAKKYSRLTIAERKQINQLNKQGFGIRGIARRLYRSPSTISDELNRGGRKGDQYHHNWAQRNANILKTRNRRKKKIQAELVIGHGIRPISKL